MSNFKIAYRPRYTDPCLDIGKVHGRVGSYRYGHTSDSGEAKIRFTRIVHFLNKA